jgi:hypothetical protein
MTKYFKITYSDNTIGYCKHDKGDGINYNSSDDFTVETITKTQFTNGIQAMPKIKDEYEKNRLIENKKNELAIQALKGANVFDVNGELI